MMSNRSTYHRHLRPQRQWGRRRRRPRFGLGSLAKHYFIALGAVGTSFLVGGFGLILLTWPVAGIYLSHRCERVFRWHVLNATLGSVAKEKLRFILLWPMAMSHLLFLGAVNRYL